MGGAGQRSKVRNLLIQCYSVTLRKSRKRSGPFDCSIDLPDTVKLMALLLLKV